MVYEYEWLKILPPLVAILTAIVSQKAILSLFLGTLSGSILIANGEVLESIRSLFYFFVGVFWDSQFGPKYESISLLIFLWALGILGDMMEKSGSIQALATILAKNCASKVQTQLLVMIMGILVFIDDFFNSIVVGAVSKKLMDKMSISREKLAYILDSTAGPICMIAPISSWGASIIVILSAMIQNNQIKNISGFSLFLQSIPYNFYALIALFFLLISILTSFDFKRMRTAEQNLSKKKAIHPSPHHHRKKEFKPESLGAIIPFTALSLTTVAAMILTGLPHMSLENFSIIQALENSQVGKSLLIGATVGIFSSLPWELRSQGGFYTFKSSTIRGLKSMLPAITTLVFSWSLASTISSLETGAFISSCITNTTISFQLIPASFFIISGLTSFSTGTSFGTFGIFLPIACQVGLAMGQAESLPLLIGAVLGGAIFGDHSSPISDTSILSSAGAGCDHMSHVLTQLPYCLFSGLLALIGYCMAPHYGIGMCFVTMVCLMLTFVFSSRISNQPSVESL